jgi:hypothetical protein
MREFREARLRILTQRAHDAAKGIFAMAKLRSQVIADGIAQALCGPSGGVRAPETPPPSPPISVFMPACP